MSAPGSLDDPNRADQRPGFLTAPADAIAVPGLVLPGNPVGSQPVFLVFDRRVPPAAEYADALKDVPRSRAVVIVVPRAARHTVPRGRLVVDPAGRVAAAVRIDRPRDGGSPVGYAAIDARARVRYVTLDPAYLDHSFENGLIAEAVR